VNDNGPGKKKKKEKKKRKKQFNRHRVENTKGAGRSDEE